MLRHPDRRGASAGTVGAPVSTLRTLPARRGGRNAHPAQWQEPPPRPGTGPMLRETLLRLALAKANQANDQADAR